MGNTALLVATEDGYIEIVEILIRAGADVNVRGSNGWTPLMNANAGKYTEIIELLKTNGAIE